MQPVVVVRPTTSMRVVVRRMLLARAAAAAVVPCVGQIGGLITPEELRHRERSIPLAPGTMAKAGDVMRSDVVVAAQDEQLVTLCHRLALRNATCAVVVDRQRPVGTVRRLTLLNPDPLNLA